MIAQVGSGRGGERCGKHGSTLRESVNLGQPCRFFRFGKEAGAEGVDSQLTELVARKSLLGMGEEELICEVGGKEGRIVGVESDQEAAIEIAAEGMGGEGRTDAGADIGGGIELESCSRAPRFKLLEKFFVLDCGKGMTDALGADGEGFPDGLRTGGFARVVGEAEAGGLGSRVKVPKRLGAGAPLIAAETDSDDGRVMFAHLGGFAEDAIGFLDGEVANSVKDPIEGEAKLARSALAGAFEAGEDGLEAAGIEVTPHIDDADRNEDLGVDDALCGELLHHVPGDYFVIFWVAEAARDGLEGLNEFGEVGKTVERLGVVVR